MDAAADKREEVTICHEHSGTWDNLLWSLDTFLGCYLVSSFSDVMLVYAFDWYLVFTLCFDSQSCVCVALCADTMRRGKQQCHEQATSIWATYYIRWGRMSRLQVHLSAVVTNLRSNFKCIIFGWVSRILLGIDIYTAFLLTCVQVPVKHPDQPSNRLPHRRCTIQDT